MVLYFQAILGLILIIGLAWALSENRRAFPYRTVAAGLALQIALAALFTQVPGSQTVFEWVGDGVDALVRATEAGTSLVFGFLGGGALPYDETIPGGSYVFALRALALIIFVGALSAVLYHLRLLPLVVRCFGWVLSRALNISGAASFSTAANVFLGMVDSPLLVRPYIQSMNRSELFVVMTAGMATIAGTVYSLFAVILDGIIPDPAGHLLTASLISAPAAIIIALIMIPRPADATYTAEVELESLYENTIDALTRGAIDGLRLVAYIVGMLIVFVGLVELANIILGVFPDVDGAELTMQRLLGWVMAPAAWLLGVPWSEAVDAGQLLGTKVVLNELVAYLNLAALPEGALSEKSSLIMTYAVCGFATFGSIGIMLGGLGALVPERRLEIAKLGLRSILAGTMATCMTGAIVGMLY